MTPAEVLDLAAGLGVKAARDWLAGEGVTLSDDLIADARASLLALFRGPGVTHAKRLVIEDLRAAPEEG